MSFNRAKISSFLLFAQLHGNTDLHGNINLHGNTNLHAAVLRGLSGNHPGG